MLMIRNYISNSNERRLLYHCIPLQRMLLEVDDERCLLAATPIDHGTTISLVLDFLQNVYVLYMIQRDYRSSLH
jgi:hypothetical protein